MALNQICSTDVGLRASNRCQLKFCGKKPYSYRRPYCHACKQVKALGTFNLWKNSADQDDLLPC